MGNIYDLGTSYNNILVPDVIDFTVTLPEVTTEKQPTNWYIGDYVEEGSVIPIKIYGCNPIV